MTDNWRLLDWELVCDQAPLIQKAYGYANLMEEYGVNFYEFIYGEWGLASKAQEWWDSLPVTRRKELIAERTEQIRKLLKQLEAAKEL